MEYLFGLISLILSIIWIYLILLLVYNNFKSIIRLLKYDYEARIFLIICIFAIAVPWFILVTGLNNTYWHYEYFHY